MRKSLRNNPLFQRPRPKAKPRKWSVFRITGKALRRTCTTLGALLLVSMFIIWGYALFFDKERITPLPDDMVLLIEVEGPFVERTAQDYLSGEFFADQITVREVTGALEKAKTDDRVKGALIAIKSGGMDLAQIQEIRQALQEFKASGKFITSYATSFGDSGNSLGSYYLAASASEIWMQPIGTVSVTGFNAELPFAREALDYLGIRPEFIKRKEYKSAVEPLTSRKISEPTKEMMSSIVTDLGEQFVADIAMDRGLSQEVVKDLVDVGLFIDQEALSSGLIDRLGYGDMVISDINKKVVGDPEARDTNFINIDYYDKRRESEIRKELLKKSLEDNTKQTVALVYVNGAIMPRDESASYMTGRYSKVASAEKISTAILDASKMDDIKAVILRIDSPGGSPTASETIRRAIVKAKERKKIVIVSMASTAASGGYWIAPDAHRIVALPGTLTGSIGVVGGKFVLKDLWDKININWASITYGQSAGMWSSREEFSQKERKRFEANLDAIYNGFIQRVAEGRGLSVQAIEKVAKGRAWTGRQALKHNLVDKLGGLNTALDLTATELGVKSRKDLDVVVLPRQRTFKEQLYELFQKQIFLGDMAYKSKQVIGSAMMASLLHQIDMAHNPSHYVTYSDFNLE